MKDKTSRSRPSKLPLVQALAWIVGSIICVSGGGYSCMKFWTAWQKEKKTDPNHHIVAIIQTGPQKEALPTVYLAELMGLSVDRPISIFRFDCKKAENRLLFSPVIKQAHIRTVKPGAVYVDYIVRQPIAWIGDYDNTAIDEEGVLFPVSPFFTPKNLPGIYLGLAPFGIQSEDSEVMPAFWNSPRQDKYTKLALCLLDLIKKNFGQESFNLKRIDVSNAFAESYGIREIVVSAEDKLFLKRDGREYTCIFPRLLRLSTKNFTQELGNYLKLRDQLIQQEALKVKITGDETFLVRMPEKIIDFRIPQLAFIGQKNDS